MFDFGLLGINARNLDYVKKFNPRKGIRLADDKNRTKRFLSERGIPVAETYGRIKTEDELRHFDFDALPEKFVVKPNRGSKGQGIMIVRKVRREETTFFKASGAEYERGEFARRLSDILQGEYSVTS
jgi:glutathione synthase/RimK-type ligase-like ATP-grasp enzyme